MLALLEAVVLVAPFLVGALWCLRRERRRRLAAETRVLELTDVADTAVETALEACSNLSELQAHHGMFRQPAPALEPPPLDRSFRPSRELMEHAGGSPLNAFVILAAVALVSQIRKSESDAEKT